MKLVLIGVGGILAHAVSLLLAQYAQWLLGKVIRGIEDGSPFLEDLQLFVRWVLRGLAGQLCDRRGYASAREFGDLQPDLYGN